MKRSPLPRRKPLSRKTRLVAKTALKRKARLRQRSEKKARTDAELERSKRIVRRRSGGWCEVPGCTLKARHFHHRRMRSQGGTHAPENLLHTCAPCHNEIHGNPQWAYDAGLLVRGREPSPPSPPSSW